MVGDLTTESFIKLMDYSWPINTHFLILKISGIPLLENKYTGDLSLKDTKKGSVFIPQVVKNRQKLLIHPIKSQTTFDNLVFLF